MSAEHKIQRRTIESKKKLLTSAYTLFVEKGYYNTNTKEIVKYAGISTGNFYNYYQDKADIYCTLLEDYCNNSCKAMKELIDKLIKIDNRASCKTFLLTNLNQLLERFNGTNKFFEDSIVISKENTRVQSIIFKAEECLITMIEKFLKKRYPDKHEDFYIRARMIYIITDRVAKDILCVSIAQQKQEYILLLVEEILYYAFDL